MIPEPQQTYLLEFLAALGQQRKISLSLAPKPLSSHSQQPGEPRISTSSST